ncbi:MAG: hypothetical protein ACR2PV_01130 [Gammaproteobacteria bacterium]
MRIMQFIMMFVVVLAMGAAVEAVLANDLPKCRNVAGYEPKPTCQARNQRAQWQAEQTARLVALGIAETRNKEAQNSGIMATIRIYADKFMRAIRGFF